MSIKKIEDPALETEAERLRALREYEILDGTTDEELNDLVELASEICETPISLVTLIDEDRQWYRAKKGIDENGTSRDVAFCNYTILQHELVEIKDATKDERVKDNPYVTSDEDHIRYYAGVPLTNRNGYNLGSLCVVDTEPRELNDFQTKSLKFLAKQVVRKLDYDLDQKRLCEHARCLKQTNQKLEQLSRLNVNLLSAIAHDLRNNLAGSESVLSLIKGRVDLGEEMDFLVNEQLKGTHQAYKLLSDMVTWGSSYVKSGEINKEAVKLSDAVDSVLTDLSDHASKKNLRLQNRIPDGLSVHSDPEMLKFLFRNLVQNALKFSEGGKVEVGYDPDGSAFYVSDQGQGMSNLELEKLFSWDRSKVKVGTDGEPGSGIGLMLCKDFVDRHDGEIWAESTEGVGTTFFFTLEPKA
ncbi:GAF domain-containing sensor histidine kinase [Halocola ammonii]